MKKWLFGILILASSSAFANSHPRPDAAVLSYPPLDQDSARVLAMVATKAWIQKIDIGVRAERFDRAGNPVPEVRPFGYQKNLRFSLQQRSSGRAFGLIRKAAYSFGMIGGTFEGSDGRFSTGGGGYGVGIPLVRMGAKKTDEHQYEFLFWAREEYYVNPEARRMHTHVLNPKLVQSQTIQDFVEAAKSDPGCADFQPIFGFRVFCAVREVIFDYLVLRYSPLNPGSLQVVGRNLNSNQDLFAFEMTSSDP
jgi:hypothetical protein